MRFSDLRFSSYSLLTRGLLVLASLSMVLGFVEVVLRVVAPVRWEGPYHADLGDAVEEGLLQRSAIPGLAYELVPGMTAECWGGEVRVNQKGMRSSEHFEHLSESAVRILTLGDEATFGRLVDQERAYPSVLGRLLNGDEFKPGCEFEVLNMGVSGYGVADAASVLQYRGLGLNPDLILVSYSLDDPEGDDLQPMKLRLNGVPWWQHFHLGRLLSQRKLEKAVQREAAGDYFEYLHSEGSPGWQRVQDSFALLKRLAHRANGEQVPVMIVLVPDLRGLAAWDHYAYGALHARLSELGQEHHIEVLDLRKEFELVGAVPGELVGESGMLDAKGYRLMANAIFRHLEISYPCLARR